MRQRNLGIAGEESEKRGNDDPSKSFEQNDVKFLEVLRREPRDLPYKERNENAAWDWRTDKLMGLWWEKFVGQYRKSKSIGKGDFCVSF